MSDEGRKGSGWRGGRATRLEALTDAVFGFSIALLIVSVEVPADFEALIDTMKGFAGFALSFAMLILVWYYHYRYFQRYCLEDGRTVLLNSVLLFVVLFYVYPLKYVFSVITQMLSGSFPLGFDEVAVLMAVYSAGFAAVFLIFALMYQHAYRSRDELGLDELEAVSSAQHIGDCVIMAGAGALATAIAIALPTPWAGPLAGFSYFLIFPAQLVNSRYFGRKLNRSAVSAPPA
jgi:uncharacterized membrane protein